MIFFTTSTLVICLPRKQEAIYFTPNPELVLAPTPIEKPTPEPTKPSEQFPGKRPSFLDEVGWREEIRTEVMGFPVSVDIVTGKTLQERDWFAIEKIEFLRQF